MLDVVFLSRVIPPDVKDEVLSKRKGTMSESGESLQWKIIEGLDANLNHPVKMMNYLPVQSYPTSYDEPYIRRREFSHTEGACDVCLPFLNVKYIKRIFMGGSLYKEIKEWARSDAENEKVIISYSLIPEFTKAIAIAKNINPGIKACAIVADLPEYTVLTNSIDWSTRIYLNWMKKKTNMQLEKIDYFVLLTEPMAERLVTHQKYIVMEGISSKFPVEAEQTTGSGGKRRIIYAGTLNERFGVMNLVKAFTQMTDPSFELVICGIGDSEQTIKEIAKQDPRIVFMGQLKREQVLQEMVKACVIVNPRPDGEEFTKYSFPSKNLEALSSGIPFVGYKLAGIRDEYDAYINYPIDESSEGLAQILMDVGLDRDGAYRAKAIAAQKWVDENKNNLKQTARILDMIEVQ